MPGEAYKIYLEYFGLDDLFDEIYVSSDYGMTKKSGKLYKKIMEINHLKANDLFMIGDSKLSDYLKPRELGINSKHYFPLLHKLETNCTKIFCKNYEKKLLKFSYRKCRKYTTFSEYYLNILYFTRKLGEYVKNTSDNICFLSRGGYFLKKCYGFSRKLEDLPKSQYLKISRKVVKNSKEEIAKKNLLRSYLDGFIKNGKLTIVDEGWYCHTQIDLCNLYDLDLKGYYIGVCENDNISGHICERKGILFEIDEAHKKSSFYGIFRSNLTFYEQILTSNEGSVIDYEKHDNLIIPIDKINIIENNLYNNYTKNLQKQIFENLKGAYFWKLKPTKEFVAKKMIWTLMAFSRKKNQFLSNYKNPFVNNVNQSTNSFKEKIKVKLDILFFSTHYMRYICKLKESNNLFIKMLYITFLPLLLIHIYFSYFFERVVTKVK